MDEGLLRRLFDIENRLRAIEGRIPASAEPPREPPGSPVPPIAPPPLPPVASARVEVAAMSDAANTRAAHGGGTPDAATAAPASASPPRPTPAASPLPGPPPAAPFRRSPTAPAAARPAASPGAVTASSVASPVRPDLEQTIGLKWAGWVGAIVLVIGTALGIKFAYDQQWFGRVPDGLRCGLIAAGGLLLVGVGEAVFRRVDRLAASGLYGAGVAVLFLAAFAGQAWYGLFGPGVAIGLMAGAAATGMAIAARADLVSIAALTVLGAGVTPACFGVPPQHDPGFLLYLLFLQATAVGLCFWRATPKWWTLRGLSLAVTTVWLIALPVRSHAPWPDLVQIGVVLLSAAAYQGELIVTTARAATGTWLGRTRGGAFSLLTTAALTLELLETFDGRPKADCGALLIALAVVAFLLGTFLRRPALRPLARGFDVQAVVLLTLAVPVLLDGPAALVGWMLLSAALATLAATSRDRLAAGGAVALWALAVAGVYDWAGGTDAARHVWLRLGGEAVTAAVVLGGMLAVAAHLAAFAVRRARHERFRRRPGLDTASVVDFAGVAAFAGLLAMFASTDFFTRVAIGYGLILWAASCAPGLAALGAVATAVLSLTAAKWVSVDVLVPRLSRGWTPAGRSFVNAQTATGLTLAAAFAVTGWVDRRRLALANAAGPVDDGAAARADLAWAVAFTVAVVVFGFAVGVDVDRAVVARHAAGGLASWPGFAAQSLLLTVVGAACVTAWTLVLRRTLATAAVRRDVVTCARGAAYLLAAKFVAVDVIGPAVAGASVTVPVVFDLRAAVAVVVGGLLVFTGRRTDDVPASPATGVAVIALLLVTGSAEIDRYAVRQTAGPVWIVRQVGWSIYWAALAVGALVAGFAFRRRPLRLAALALLATTLLKVTLVDLTGVGTGWRILSFLGLGALLLLTSVLYGRFRGFDQDENATRIAADGTAAASV